MSIRIPSLRIESRNLRLRNESSNEKYWSLEQPGIK
jgi:hypothetical protein